MCKAVMRKILLKSMALVFFASTSYANPRSGSYCAKIQDANGNGYVYQMVAVSPSTAYDFSGWVYDNDPAGSVSLKIYWYPSADGSGTSISNVVSTFTIDALNWQHLPLTATSPGTALSAKVRFTFNGGVNPLAYTDDFSFKQSGNATELLTNTGFEGGLTTGWVKYGMDTFSVVTGTGGALGGGGGAGAINAKITEVAPGISNGDFIELFVTAASDDTGGCKLYEGATLIKTFPTDIGAVAKDTHIVLWASKTNNPTGVRGVDRDETSADENKNGYIDLYSDESSPGITNTDNNITLTNADGAIADFMSFADSGTTYSASKPAYNSACAADEWSPPAATDSEYISGSIAWGGSTSKSMQRYSDINSQPTDTNKKDDWKQGNTSAGRGYGGASLVTSKILEVKTPNPFSPHDSQSANISFALTSDTAIKTLRVFNVKGVEVRRLIDQDRNLVEGGSLSGQRTGFITWDGKDDYGNIVPVGIYIINMEAYDPADASVVKNSVTAVVARQFQ